MKHEARTKQYLEGLQNLRNDLRGLNLTLPTKHFDIINDMSKDTSPHEEQVNIGFSELTSQAPQTPVKRVYSEAEQWANVSPEIRKQYLNEQNQKSNEIATQTQELPEKRRKFSDKHISRRDLLIAGGLLGSAIALKTIKTGTIPFANEIGNLFKSSENETTKAGTMVLGNEEKVFRDEMIGYASWTPDGPITYYETASGKRRYLLTGGQDNATYMLESDGKRTLKEIMAGGEINENSFKKVYGPDKNVKFRREYAGITGVLQIDKGNKDHLLGIAHCEERTDRDASGDYTATIGLAESFDGGLTWKDKGVLITGTDVKTPGGGKVSGAGQPSVVLNEKDGYAYIMYIDWSATGKHKDQLYMARVKANDNGSIGEVEYYKDSGFSANLDANKQKPVIPVPGDSNMVYMALPHVSWNIELNQYICEGESDTGFWMANSTDLLNWSKPEIIYDFTKRGGKPHSILKAGEKWDSYPTALSENQPNSQITDGRGILYHSSGDNIVPHEPAAVNFEIK